MFFEIFWRALNLFVAVPITLFEVKTMVMKCSGYVPNNIPNLYSNSTWKLEQSSGVQNKAEVEGVSKGSSLNSTNIDRIQLSQQPINYTSLSKARDQILSDINKDKDVSFLENLKEQINSNKYEIDAHKLAQIMLGSGK
jgi:anti-sigma28 factor (negative regulator of flagellin synthesis)